MSLPPDWKTFGPFLSFLFRRYRRVKIFVTERTTCNDVVDTLKLRLDIPKQIQFNLLELAFINDHVHERVVRPEELVQGL